MKNKVIKTVVFCLLFLSSLNGIAQPGEGAYINGGAPTLEETDATPINDYIIPMLLLGAVLGFSLLKRKTNPAR
jgi:hypothetical protein